MTVANSDNRYGTAQLIVAPTIAEGANYTTIAAALTAAVSGQTIFLRPGTYTENITLKAGVNICAFDCDALTPNVTIVGKATFTAAGTVSISGVRTQTNSDFFLAVTGSAASIVILKNCYLNASNNTGISYSSSSGSSSIYLLECQGNLGTTGIGLFAHTASGTLRIENSLCTNTGGSSTASTVATGGLELINSVLNFPITTSSSANFYGLNTAIQTVSTNTTSLTIGGGTSVSYNSFFNSGTASAISVSAASTLTITNPTINSSNTNAITGAGAIISSGVNFSGSSSTINTTTQTGSGTLQGSKNTAPSAGFLGEQIVSTVANGSALTVNTNTATDITSISLTAGVWDVSCVLNYQPAAITGTLFEANISATSATQGTLGDNRTQTPYSPTAASNNSLTIPSYRITISSTTSIYLVAFALYTVGTLKAYGRISGTRVG